MNIKKNSSHRRTAGFTLIELIITIGVLSILVAWGYPSLTQAINNNRMAAQNNEMLTILKYARSEAIRRNTDVTVQIAATTDGWDAFVDDPNNDANVANCAPGQLRCSSNTQVALTGTPGTIIFNNRGYIRGEDDETWLNETMYLQHHACSGQNQRRLIHVAPTGQVSSCSLPCGDTSTACPG